MKKVVCEDIRVNKFKVVVDQLSFRPAVYGVIVRDDKILFSK